MINIESLNDIEKIDFFVKKIILLHKNGTINKEELQKITRGFGEDFLQNTIQGHGLLKPFGYAGDFLIIDKIYMLHENPHEKYSVWDKYFHQQSAPKAVRNRKSYFKKFLKSKLKEHDFINMLNVASGPARDLEELYRETQTQKVETTCVEMDEKAIGYATKLNEPYLDRIKFIHKNVFKYRPDELYDIIWSAGLFDYFTDRTFVCLLERFKTWLNPGGEIVIGNFNENNNPSRDYMELFGEWYLNHRNEEKLIQLALQAGFTEKNLSIGREPENVNLFLHIKL